MCDYYSDYSDYYSCSYELSLGKVDWEKTGYNPAYYSPYEDYDEDDDDDDLYDPYW